MEHHERTRPGYLVTTDPRRFDLEAVHAFLTTAYWSAGISRQVVARAAANSLCFSLLQQGGGQVGLARVVTDQATFAYLCDVYVLPEHRGRGLARWLMQCVMEHPAIPGLRRFSLVTRDAHPLYRQLGFTPLAMPDRHMELVRPDIYRNAASDEDPPR